MAVTLQPSSFGEKSWDHGSIDYGDGVRLLLSRGVPLCHCNCVTKGPIRRSAHT